MVRYYLNKKPQENGDHEVHKPDCSWMPEPENCLYLGEFSTCYAAVLEAMKDYSQANGCFHCSRECHTR